MKCSHGKQQLLTLFVGREVTRRGHRHIKGWGHHADRFNPFPDSWRVLSDTTDEGVRTLIVLLKYREGIKIKTTLEVVICENLRWDFKATIEGADQIREFEGEVEFSTDHDITFPRFHTID